jgi:hypothetical protein
MKCPRCQHKNEAGAKFCEECATPLAQTCAGCGRQLSATAKFCPECARPTGLSAGPPPAQRFGAPECCTHRPRPGRPCTPAPLPGQLQACLDLTVTLPHGDPRLVANPVATESAATTFSGESLALPDLPGDLVLECLRAGPKTARRPRQGLRPSFRPSAAITSVRQAAHRHPWPGDQFHGVDRGKRLPRPLRRPKGTRFAEGFSERKSHKACERRSGKCACRRLCFS